jgi:hypothetical protein
VFGHNLAHAELNALLSLDLDVNDPCACVLYTTMEPCPLCAGAMRMTDVGELRYAAMFETVPYLRRRNVRVLGPEDGRLETILVALLVERFLRLEPEILVLAALQGSHAGDDEGGEEGLSLGVAAGDEQGWGSNPGGGPSP